MTISPTPQIFYIDIIIHLINDYLIHEDNLLNCNKYLFNLKIKYFKLNTPYSLKYVEDIYFKNVIDSKIKNSKLQLSLNLSCCNKITDEGVKHLGNLHTLNLYCCRNITDEAIKMLGNLHTLNLSGCDKITDEGIRHLGNLHTLDLHLFSFQTPIL